MADELAGALTPAEEKYISSRGESPIEANPDPMPETPATEQPASEESTQEQSAPAEDKPKFVPLAALHEERQKRQALQKTVEDQRVEQAKLSGRLEQLFQLAQTPQRAQEAPPAPPDQDPVGAVVRHERDLAAIKDGQKRLEDQRRAEAEQQRIMQAYQGQAREFAKTNPDFGDAYKHLLSDRDSELQDLGYADPSIRAQILLAEEMGIVTNALASNANPAERLYKIAQRRGYKKAAAQQAAAPVETLARGQAAAASLGSTPGSATPRLTIESLAKMDDEDFAKIATDPRKWRQVMGG